MKKPDSIIFDMDGTLWDPMDLYVSSWNAGLKEAGVQKMVTKDDIKPLMGLKVKRYFLSCCPNTTKMSVRKFMGL